MTPEELYNSLNKLITETQFPPHVTDKIHEIMHEVELLPYISDSTKLVYCMDIIRLLRTKDEELPSIQC